MSYKQLRMAIQVLIRTGMRPMEYAQLTAEHITDHGDKMEFKFRPEEIKTRKARTIRLVDAELIETVRNQMELHKLGPIFRNRLNRPWIVKSLSRSFTRAKNRAKKAKFDDDSCLYSCRHTYAKRVLTGYWTGKPVSIELLAMLMGNSPAVCRANYLQWSDSYTAPLWEAVG